MMMLYRENPLSARIIFSSVFFSIILFDFFWPKPYVLARAVKKKRIVRKTIVGFINRCIEFNFWLSEFGFAGS
jgi:hypothetical protein